MRLIPRSQKAIAFSISAICVVLAIIGVGLFVVVGGLDSGDQLGSAEGFEATAAPAGNAASTSWPEYGYDMQRTRANAALLLAPPFTRAWKRETRSLVEFPPVAANGRLVVATNGRYAQQLNIATGGIYWYIKLSGRAAASPAIAGDLVLFATDDGYITARRWAHAEVVWRVKVGPSTESSPLVTGKRFYVGDTSGGVHCMSVATGRTIWTARASGAVKSSLALSGRDVVVGDYAGQVTAFNARTGRVHWRATSPGKLLGGNGGFYANPAVAYGRIYIANINGRVIALDAHDGSIAWVRVIPDWVYSSPAVSGRTVFVGSYDHRLYALDAVTGGVRWAFDAGERIAGSPTVIGNYVWFATLARRPADGRTYALNTSTGAKAFTFRDGRYTPAIGVEGRLILAGVRTIYGMAPAP